MSRPAFEGYTGEELDAKITELLDSRQESGEPQTIEYLMYALGVSKDTMWRYRKHEPDKYPDGHAYNEHCDAIKRAYARCELYLSDGLHKDKRYAPGAMFALKCCYGWQETPLRIDTMGGFRMIVDTSAAANPDADPDNEG